MKVIESDKIPPLFRLLLMNNKYADPIINEVQEIVDMQSIDPVHAAGGCYCRECCFGRTPCSEDMRDGYVYCQQQSWYKQFDAFCSDGEPKETRK